MALVLLAVTSSIVYSHCQIPCGIYDDEARIEMIAEHITTIEKSMSAINELSSVSKPDYNQIVRWIDSKERHANAASEIVSYYFLTQRIKPVVNNGQPEYQQYIKKLTVLHEMLIHYMKAKQSTDVSEVVKLRELLSNFEKDYFLNRK